MVSRLCKSRRLQKGQGLVEYALILMLVGVAVIVAVSLFGTQVKNAYCQVIGVLGGDLQDKGCPIQVQCVGSPSGSNPFSLEAIVNDTIGADNITNVVFSIDGTTINTEGLYRYCLQGGDSSCQLYNPSGLSSGSHTIRALATDGNGNTGSCSVGFTKP